ENQKSKIEHGYVLATGDAGAERLRILERIYGPGTRELLLRAGLKPGMRVADIGCGIGSVTRAIADIVGPTGAVVGVDMSSDQIEQARECAESAGQAQASFTQTSATETGLPRE